MANKPITKEEFNKHKQRQALGQTITHVSKQTGRSWDAVRRMFEAETFEDYQGSYRRDKPETTVTSEDMLLDAEEPVESPTITAVRKARAEMVAHFDAVIDALLKLEGRN